jgi:hypothetical protein
MGTICIDLFCIGPISLEIIRRPVTMYILALGATAKFPRNFLKIQIFDGRREGNEEEIDGLIYCASHRQIISPPQPLLASQKEEGMECQWRERRDV